MTSSSPYTTLIKTIALRSRFLQLITFSFMLIFPWCSRERLSSHFPPHSSHSLSAISCLIFYPSIFYMKHLWLLIFCNPLPLQMILRVNWKISERDFQDFCFKQKNPIILSAFRLKIFPLFGFYIRILFYLKHSEERKKPRKQEKN